MSKPFDATSKCLFHLNRRAWARFIGVKTDAPLTEVNPDVSTVTSAADFAFIVNAPQPWLEHIEFVSAHQPDIVLDSFIRHVVFRKREGINVRTTLILLSRDAFRASMDGIFKIEINGRIYSQFTYMVIKIYEMTVDQLLAQDVAILPLVVLSQEIQTQEDAKSVLFRLHDALVEKLGNQTELLGTAWTAAEILLSLKFKGAENKSWIKKLTRGVLTVRDSAIYQEILEEGRMEQLQEILLKWGRKRFGQPLEGERVALEAIDDLERLKSMEDRLFDVKTWADLLAIR